MVRDSERGVALVMAMMIVALITVIAVEISWRFELAMSRSANRWYGGQADAYLEGAEQLAMVLLKEDLEDEETSKADHLAEPWAQDAQPFPTDHGYVSGKILDAHGRFNLNAMKPRNGTCRNGQPPPQQEGRCPPPIPGSCDSYTPAQQMFVRLLQTVNLAPPSEDPGLLDEPLYLQQDEAEAIAEAVIDWLDEDSEITGFGGAESDYYSQLEVPVSIANKEMVSVSELSVVRGMTPPLYRGLLPHIIALPDNKFGRMNLNTATLNVLQTVKTKGRCNLTPFDPEIGQSLESFMAGGEFTDWQEMTDDAGLPTEWTNPQQEIDLHQELFGFGPSQYFILLGEVGIGDDYVRRGMSLIYRPPGAGSSGGGDDDGGENLNNSRGGSENSRGGNSNGGATNPDAQIKVVRRTDANF